MTQVLNLTFLIIGESQLTNEIDIKLERLPYMYIALLEYCSEVTGDSTTAIDNHIEQTVGLNLLRDVETLNG